MPSPTRIRGDAAEQLAVEHLRQQGYSILTRNYGTRNGEVDIVAREGQILCFVEVRSRQRETHGGPLQSVDHAKQRRIANAARNYLAQHDQEDPEIRFDVVAVVQLPRPRIQLVRGAFEAAWAW